jgi:SpoVK/Ycf46/Vps4 family AAA+-type ATPase
MENEQNLIWKNLYSRNKVDVLSSDGSINLPNLYFGFFQELPSIKKIEDLETKKVMKWFEDTFQNQILHSFKKEEYIPEKRKIEIEEVSYLLADKILVLLSSRRSIWSRYNCTIVHGALEEEKCISLIAQLSRFIKRDRYAQDISIIIQQDGELRTKELPIKRPKISIEENYNDDLQSFHEKLLPVIRKKNKSGLILLHGTPGTGKSTYVRHIAKSISKDVIFLPPKLAGNLENPDLIKILIDNRNCVFVIEDAEDLIVSRENNYVSSISMLLNITDGILGEALGIQIIATFNTDIRNIDKALLRKGRLIGMYEFKPLSIDKSKALLEKNGHTNVSVTQPMTLADIYNYEEESYSLQKKQKTPIGFLATVN